MWMKASNQGNRTRISKTSIGDDGRRRGNAKACVRNPESTETIEKSQVQFFDEVTLCI